MLSIAVSCDDLCFRDLCYDHSHIVSLSIRFDWNGCPDACPESMSVWFYSLDDPASAPRRYDLPGRDGGTVRISY
ncbi:MAG: DUF5119 domain-containing protein, partial [Bacteroidia bacterium]|nr:DUF5119 domain-containing protein [Bacteroidia bacterium]